MTETLVSLGCKTYSYLVRTVVLPQTELEYLLDYCNEEVICEVLDQKSTTDSSADENGLIFPGFTQLRSGRIAMDYRLRKTYF